MTDLSPAARAVMDAWWNDSKSNRSGIAAALRAAADQVVPLDYEDVWIDGRMLQFGKHDPVREKLIAIAAELEGSHD